MKFFIRNYLTILLLGCLVVCVMHLHFSMNVINLLKELEVVLFLVMNLVLKVIKFWILNQTLSLLLAMLSFMKLSFLLLINILLKMIHFLMIRFYLFLKNKKTIVFKFMMIQMFTMISIF